MGAVRGVPVDRDCAKGRNVMYGGGGTGDVQERKVKREEVRSFAVGAFIILSVYYNISWSEYRRAAVPDLFLLGRFSFLIFPLSLADILKVLNI